MNVAIIDYGLGNLFSINNACKLVGLNTIITSDINKISKADALILPGVGAFGDAINSLNENNLTQTIYEFVRTGKPFLGICQRRLIWINPRPSALFSMRLRSRQY